MLQNIRESASLIILSKEIIKSQTKPNYKVLLFNRTPQASFMPNSSVFPGGVQEKTDESLHWLNLYSKFGLLHKVQELVGKSNKISSFFKSIDASLEKELSLRITAIRETFEEVGILLARNPNTISEVRYGYGHLYDKLDSAKWQHLVHNDSTKFLTLCEELNVVPDLWSLYDWATWMTPSTFKKRFITAFFLVSLESMPNLVVEKNEVMDYSWKTPAEYLNAFSNKEVYLPPPQFYELSRLLNMSDLDELKEYARNISDNTPFILPVQYKCADGKVALLPGDDMYPADPNASTDFIPVPKTMQEFRANAKKLHRSEHKNQYSSVLLLNFLLPNGHLAPLKLDSTVG